MHDESIYKLRVLFHNSRSRIAGYEPTRPLQSSDTAPFGRLCSSLVGLPPQHFPTMAFRLITRALTQRSTAVGVGRIGVVASPTKIVNPTCAIAVRFFDSASNKKAFDEFRANLSPARRKLFDILNNYRTENYAQCLPSRFLKDIIKAVDANGDGVITKAEYFQLLKNIGHEGELTDAELDEIFNEVGVEDSAAGEKVIPVEVLMEKWKPLLSTIPLRG